MNTNARVARNSPFVENKDLFKLLGPIVSYRIDIGYHIKGNDNFCTSDGAGSRGGTYEHRERGPTSA